MIEFYCSVCQRAVGYDRSLRCDGCGGLWQFRCDRIDLHAVEQDRSSLLRYRAWFPAVLREVLETISLGEGWTPLIRAQGRLAEVLDTDTWVKMDQLMPTMSFKDRGAVFVVAMAAAMGAKKIVQDSSGNAGHAVATYAARAGIPCDIFLPASTSPAKIQLIEAAGATVCPIEGSREATAEAALVAASAPNAFYASHVYNPLFFEGTKTYLFEMYEQCAGELPENIVVPVGNGTLLLGICLGLEALSSAGRLSRTPRLIAVQAANCAPLMAASSRGDLDVPPVVNTGTLAEGIAIAAPQRGHEILTALDRWGGQIVTANEEEILAMHGRLASTGLHVEHTAAATFAAFQQHRNRFPGSAVIPVCGAGIKSLGKK